MKTKSKNKSHYNIVTIALLILLLFVTGCEISNDRPPDRDGPEPEPHQGVFVSDHAVFTFEEPYVVYVEFDEQYLEALDNPPNNTHYRYVFTWYSFGQCRYDAASELSLFHEESKLRIRFMLNGMATPERIPIMFPAPEGSKIVFIKQEQ